MHWPDLVNGEDVPGVLRKMAKLIGYRSMVFAPMLWDERGIGAIGVARSTGPFKPKELAMLQTFADQAVIAIQNARLFNETKEALEQQTATAEVLQVISGSMADARPVFEKILQSCQRLFASDELVTMLVGGDGRLHLAASLGPYGSNRDQAYTRPFRDSATALAISKRSVLHYPEIQASADAPLSLREMCQSAGIHSLLMAPMLWAEQGVGSILVGRTQARAFTGKEIALLKTFADQAVIAIQNARLFNETKEALEQQTATAEILRVISGSVTDTQPVFDAIVQSCRRLFGGKAVHLAMPRGDMIESVAYAADDPDRTGVGFLKPWPLDRGSGAGTCILESRVIGVADTAEGVKQFPRMHDLAIALGYRSCLFVPLLREGKAIGSITILRETTGEFDRQEVALAQTFADQAVIAIENARLFNETKEALARQTASGEILRVISASVTDSQPVFDAIVACCQRPLRGQGGQSVAGRGQLARAGRAGERRDDPQRRRNRPLAARPRQRVG